MAKARHAGMFKPGKSGNPGGRTKKRKEIEALCQTVLEGGALDRNWAVMALKDIALGRVTSAIAGEPEQPKARPISTGDRMRAIELLMGYAYGKPRIRAEIAPATGDQGETWTLRFGDQVLEFK